MASSYQVTDQMGRKISVPQMPARIISLVPSQTELLYDLGLDTEVVGQTLFCIHPYHQHAYKPRVGGTKNIHFEKVTQLNPDLIIGNKEENDQRSIEHLAAHYPVWMSNIQNLNNALEMIEALGKLVGKAEAAEKMVASIEKQFAQLIPSNNLRVAYFIWRKPWMVAAGHTFINDMLQRMGLNNVFQHLPSRYPQLSNEDIIQHKPQIVFLSSEPYPFKQQHIDELKTLLPQAQILLVDGELFSWYGSRLLQSVSYFSKLLHQISG
jgi:ABC-type Fe3+-hydroxamate transport system substrate-binding protein